MKHSSSTYLPATISAPIVSLPLLPKIQAIDFMVPVRFPLYKIGETKSLVIDHKTMSVQQSDHGLTIQWDCFNHLDAGVILQKPRSSTFIPMHAILQVIYQVAA